MDESSSNYADYTTEQRLVNAREASTRSIDLESIVVRYDQRPDRCTITPRECTDSERVTMWLSADLDAFVELADSR